MSMCHGMGNGMHTSFRREAHESHGRGHTGNGADTQRTLQRMKASRSVERQLVTARGNDAAVTSGRLLKRERSGGCGIGEACSSTGPCVGTAEHKTR